MLRRFTRVSLMILCLGIMSVGLAHAQQLIWNVPAPAVMDRGQFGASVVMFSRPWDTASGQVESSVVQGFYGLDILGHQSEVGLNVGPINWRNVSKSNTFADLAIKVRLVNVPLGGGPDNALGINLGTTAGIGLSGATSGHLRNYTYLSPFLNLSTGTRVSAGAYYATRDVFDLNDRFGGQFTFEQALPVVKGLAFVADYQTGNNAAATLGLTYTRGNYTLGAGYGLSNNGSKDNALTFIGGVNF